MTEAQRERRRPDGTAEQPPPAGPHAKDSLTDHDKTPGTGALPEKGQSEVDVGPD
ncbi:hypothetical protein [Rhizobium sp.]